MARRKPAPMEQISTYRTGSSLMSGGTRPTHVFKCIEPDCHFETWYLYTNLSTARTSMRGHARRMHISNYYEFIIEEEPDFAFSA